MSFLTTSLNSFPGSIIEAILFCYWVVEILFVILIFMSSAAHDSTWYIQVRRDCSMQLVLTCIRYVFKSL